MKVVHLVGGLANSSGTTAIVLNLARHLSDLGARVSLFHLSGRGFDTTPCADPRVEVRPFPVRASRRWGWSPALTAELRARAGEFDVLHAHSLWLHLNLAAARAARRDGRALVVAPQGALDAWSLAHRGAHKRLYAALVERRLLDGAAAIQCVSPREVENVRAFGVRAPTVVVPNGVDPDAAPAGRAEARRRRGFGDADEVVLFLGRLHPKKGLDLLLPAFAALAGRRPAARLLLAGSDSGSGYGAWVGGEVARLGLAARVAMAGEVSGEAKRDALAAGDVFVLPSHSEGQPLAALEAMAAGLPVVLTRACNVPEVEARGAGLYATPDPAGVARALEGLLGDPAARRRAGEAARAFAAERFAWRTVAARLYRVYENLQAGRPPGEGLE